jgi:hypothetical protein
LSDFSNRWGDWGLRRGLRAAAPVGMIDVVGRRTATRIRKEQP